MSDNQENDNLISLMEEGFAELRRQANTDNLENKIEEDDDEQNQEVEEEEQEVVAVQPPPKGRRATQEFQRAEAATARAEAAEKKIAELDAKINGIIGVNDILTPKSEKNIDDILVEQGLIPDDYYSDTEKKAALKQVELSHQVRQLQYEKSINETISAYEDGLAYLNQSEEPMYGAATSKGVNMLIEAEVFNLMENHEGLSEAKAQKQARNNIMAVIANKSQKTGEHPTSVAAKLGAKYAKKLNIDLMQQKALTKQNDNINIRAANNLQNSAGSANINAAATTVSKNNATLSDDYRKFLDDLYG